MLAAVICQTAALDDTLFALLDGLGTVAQDEYWQSVRPYGVPDDLVSTVARRLLEHRRAWTAIELLSHTEMFTDLDLVVDALAAPGLDGAERITIAFSPDYAVGRLLDRLQEAGVEDAQVAALEWFYQPLLQDSRSPNALYRELARDPARFVELVSLMYRPEPGQGDESTDNALASRLYSAAWTVLREWRSPLPGARDDHPPSSEAMLQWVEVVSKTLVQTGRARVLARVLADALSGAGVDEDGTWPSRPVRDVLEILGDTELEEHLVIAKMNQRGVTTRGLYDGGAQEQRIVAEYQMAANRVRPRWPRSGALLDQLGRFYQSDARREDRSADEQGDR